MEAGEKEDAEEPPGKESLGYYKPGNPNLDSPLRKAKFLSDAGLYQQLIRVCFLTAD